MIVNPHPSHDSQSVPTHRALKVTIPHHRTRETRGRRGRKSKSTPNDGTTSRARSSKRTEILGSRSGIRLIPIKESFQKSQEAACAGQNHRSVRGYFIPQSRWDQYRDFAPVQQVGSWPKDLQRRNRERCGLPRLSDAIYMLELWERTKSF